ncbi:efflux RND transporter periplasmic adaptor subunit [Chromobacterium sphagni]|uniref:Efflux transporter periplasmic adaptor subunit n=1 Tax=Chromobacterium sphagni TaxID=1903179 RepID=A0ABX3CA31_9NEIS|nr:efflux RND transporter periplasmic adaptor subunit [Chromobacterium sphagni]OHX19147.1 efflux transporter periplasmic adaptor subunit [Chromobacterium sphagni]
MRKWMIVAMTVGVAACRGPAEAPATDKPPEVGVVTLAAQDVTLKAELAGRTVAYRSAEVRPQVSGIVLQRHFVEGSQVKAGQLLYQIDPASYQAALQQAEATLASARAALANLRSRAQRYAELAKIDGISRQDGEEADAEYRKGLAAERAGTAAVAAARVELARTRVLAPISGRIGRSSVSEGALVTAGQSAALATIQQLDPIYVDVTQSSQELLRLKRRQADGELAPSGTRALLRLEDGSPYAQAGRLRFAELNVDRLSGAVTLRAEFPNPDGLLLPGMYVRVELEQGVQRNAVLAPQQGVSHDEQGRATALVLLADKRVEQRVLTTQGTQGAYWLVTAGLGAGDRLIVDGLQRARPGETATPVALPAKQGRG